MFRFFILILAIVFYLPINAQGGWKKQYTLQNSLISVCRNVIEAPDGNLVMVGLTYTVQGNNGSNQLSIVGTDASGNMLWRKDYGNYQFEYLDNILATNGAIVQDGNSFYHTLCVRENNSSRTIGVLIKFDYNGDTLWQKIYRSSDPQEDVILQGITKSVDGGLLITGFFQHWGNNTNLCLLIKTDINGNELWRKKISKAVPNVQDGRSVVQDPISKKIVVVGYQYIGSSTSWESFNNILILDSLGNKLLQTSFDNVAGSILMKVIRLKDNNFLACGAKNANSDLGGIPRWKNAAVKFDTSGGVIWSRTYDTLSRFTYMSQLIELADGNIVMCGHIDTLHNYNIEGPVKIRLYKIDKNGNLKWKKYIGSAYTYTSSEFERSLNQTQDGGFVISAWMVNRPSSFVPPYSIIKVDSTGCDTSEQWCRSVALNVSKFQSVTGWEFELFPNPASDFLSVSVNAPSGKEFSLKIIDVSGKEVGRFTYGSGTRLTVDIRHYPEGVYFATLFHDGKAIETKKLVIVH